MKVVTPRPPRFDWVEALIREARRRARRRRRWYGAAAFVAASAALLGYFGFDRGGGVTRPANEPTPASAPGGIFANVHGWIVYCIGTTSAECSAGRELAESQGRYVMPESIWAVSPTGPGDPEDQIQLSDRPGEPLAWSRDGSKLLIWRRETLETTPLGNEGTPYRIHQTRTTETALFVLNADGTETRVAAARWTLGEDRNYIEPAGSFSPDGSKVVYSGSGRIYRVDADGGTPRLVFSPSRRRFPGAYRSPTDLYAPAFSPDGTQIAYVRFEGDRPNTLRVMNADGSGVRVLIDDLGLSLGKDQGPDFGSVSNLVWSPDGSRLAFSSSPPGEGGGIWIIAVDGSGLKRVIAHGGNPSWSPDGSRISYQPFEDPLTFESGTLEIAALDGSHVTHVQKFGYGGSGPWNPLPLSTPGEEEPTATEAGGVTASVPAEPERTAFERGSGAAPFVYAIVALGVVGVLFLAWRARRRTRQVI